MNSWEMRAGDCVELMAEMSESSVDAVVCDPPYGIGFMGKAWDGVAIAEAAAKDRATRTTLGPASPSRLGRAAARSSSAFGNAATIAGPVRGGHNFQEWCETWAREVLRVLKPGGHLLSFGGTRTYHRLTSGIEDAGFEIRDCVVWLYGSGFPKSMNVGDGMGTALKPAHEPVVVARKPVRGTVASNLERHRTGALNIDACRIATTDELGGGAETGASGSRADGWDRPWKADPGAVADHAARVRANVEKAERLGRWPANVALDEEAALLIDAQSGDCPGMGKSRVLRRGATTGKGMGYGSSSPEDSDFEGYSDTGGASRFFYCAKASPAERGDGNTHPTVKPVELMRWLVRLVTPPGGVVLDPFAGSGTTGIAATREGLSFIGLEREDEYVALARERIRQDAPLFNSSTESAA